MPRRRKPLVALAQLPTPLRIMDGVIAPLGEFFSEHLSRAADAVRAGRRHRVAFVTEDEDPGGIQQWLLRCFALCQLACAVLVLLGWLLSLALVGGGLLSQIHVLVPVAMQLVAGVTAMLMFAVTSDGAAYQEEEDDDDIDDEDDDAKLTTESHSISTGQPPLPKRLGRKRFKLDPHRFAPIHLSVSVILCSLLALSFAVGRSFRSPLLSLLSAMLITLLGHGSKGATWLTALSIVPCAVIVIIVYVFRFSLTPIGDSSSSSSSGGGVSIITSLFPQFLDPVYGPELVCAIVANCVEMMSVASMCSLSLPMPGGLTCNSGGSCVATELLPVFSFVRVALLRSVTMRPSNSDRNPFLAQADIALLAQQQQQQQDESPFAAFGNPDQQALIELQQKLKNGAGFVEAAAAVSQSLDGEEPSVRVTELLATLTDISGATAALSPPSVLARLSERAHVLLDRTRNAAAAADEGGTAAAERRVWQLEKKNLFRSTRDAESALISSLELDCDTAANRKKYLQPQQSNHRNSRQGSPNHPRLSVSTEPPPRPRMPSVSSAVAAAPFGTSAAATSASSTPSSASTSPKRDSVSFQVPELGPNGAAAELSSSSDSRSASTHTLSQSSQNNSTDSSTPTPTPQLPPPSALAAAEQHQQQQQQKFESGVLAYIYAPTSNRGFADQLRQELVSSGAQLHMLTVTKAALFAVASWNVAAMCSEPEMRAVRFATTEVEFDAAAVHQPQSGGGGGLMPPRRGGRGGGGGLMPPARGRGGALAAMGSNEDFTLFGAALSAPAPRLRQQIEDFDAISGEENAMRFPETQKLKHMLIAAVEQQRWLFSDSIFFPTDGSASASTAHRHFNIGAVDIVSATKGFVIDELFDPPREIPQWMMPSSSGQSQDEDDGPDKEGTVVFRVDGVETSDVKMTPVQQVVLDAFRSAALGRLDAAGRLLDKVGAADPSARRLGAVLRAM